MKHSVQQMQQALKDGKTIFFEVPYGKVTKYKANLCLNPELVVVSWTDESGNYNDVVYKLMTFIGGFDGGWICTKIEGEETVTNKPHKHAELIKLWADTGCQIQYKYPDCETWHDCNNNRPYWELDNEYRVKPTLVKKWKWVYSDLCGELDVTGYYYTEQEFNSDFQNLTLIQKIDSTMIEVEE